MGLHLREGRKVVKYCVHSILDVCILWLSHYQIIQVADPSNKFSVQQWCNVFSTSWAGVQFPLSDIFKKNFRRPANAYHKCQVTLHYARNDLIKYIFLHFILKCDIETLTNLTITIISLFTGHLGTLPNN